MRSILNEYNDNETAKTVHELEEFMREHDIQIGFQGGHLLLSVKDKSYIVDGFALPRSFEEEKLELA